MKKLLPAVCLTILLPVLCFGQAELDAHIDKGVKQHDEGHYTEAIVSFHRALDIDSNSELANYELANTCFAAGKYDHTIRYADKVIALGGRNVGSAHVLKGSAQDLLGQSEEAINTYVAGMKTDSTVVLLPYNLGLTYYNREQYAKAQHYFQQAIGIDPSHASSHLGLINCLLTRQKRTQTLLAAYYFLLLEPDTKRSVAVLSIMDELWSKGVSKQDENHINISIVRNKADDSEFNSADLLLSMMHVSSMTGAAKAEKKSPEREFEENTRSFFTMLAAMREKRSPGENSIWWDFYVPFFGALVKAEHTEAFCFYIAMSKGGEATEKWLTHIAV